MEVKRKQDSSHAAVSFHRSQSRLWQSLSCMIPACTVLIAYAAEYFPNYSSFSTAYYTGFQAESRRGTQ